MAQSFDVPTCVIFLLTVPLCMRIKCMYAEVFDLHVFMGECMHACWYVGEITLV